MKIAGFCSKRLIAFLSAILVLIGALALSGCTAPAESGLERTADTAYSETESEKTGFGSEITETCGEEPSGAPQGGTFSDWSAIPAYSGNPYVAVNGNKPLFGGLSAYTASFESYSKADSMGRCGAAFANLGRDLMPTEERGSIGQIKPSGWQTVKYDCVDGKYLYNRCHLIGYQLSAENANPLNLITGTRYLNVDGMLPFENMTADYIKETGNHVLYRVTPHFEGENLLASGVLMEAESVEDGGKGILFAVYCYNVQPQISINYLTGESAFSGAVPPATSAPAVTSPAATSPAVPTEPSQEMTYTLNTSTKKFHRPSCASAEKIKAENKKSVTGTREELIAQGYSPCKNCDP